MKPAFKFAAGWNLTVCFAASVTSSLADSITPKVSMERIDTLGVAGLKTGRVMTAVRVMRKTARVEDMMCVLVAARRCARQCQRARL